MGASGEECNVVMRLNPKGLVYFHLFVSFHNQGREWRCMKNDKEYTQCLDLSGMRILVQLGGEVVCNSF